MYGSNSHCITLNEHCLDVAVLPGSTSFVGRFCSHDLCMTIPLVPCDVTLSMDSANKFALKRTSFVPYMNPSDF